jgi:lysosomal Pro-X carboxypeptidase
MQEFDPWRSGGVVANTSASLPALVIPGAAHHLDLFFTDPRDPPSVTQARKDEMAYVKGWVAEHYARRGMKHEL